MSLGTHCAVCHWPFSDNRPRSALAVHACTWCAYSDVVEHCAEPHPRNEFPGGRWTSSGTGPSSGAGERSAEGSGQSAHNGEHHPESPHTPGRPAATVAGTLSRTDTSPTDGALLECPHCGQSGNPYAYRDAPGENHEPVMHVACLQCGSGAPSIAIWNRRR